MKLLVIVCNKEQDGQMKEEIETEEREDGKRGGRVIGEGRRRERGEGRGQGEMMGMGESNSEGERGTCSLPHKDL